MASKHPHGEKLFNEAKQVLQSLMNYIDQLSQQAKNNSVPASDQPARSGTATPSNGSNAHPMNFDEFLNSL